MSKIDWKNIKVNYTAIGHRFDMSPEGVFFAPLMKSILESGEGKLFRHTKDGYSTKTPEEVAKIFTDLGGRLIYENNDVSNHEYSYLWDDGIVELYHNQSSKSLYFSTISTNEKIMTACKELGATLEKADKKGFVFAITRAPGGGLSMSRMGFAGVALEKANYNDEVITQYEYVVEDFKSKIPSGRLAILDGPPGTGKTFLMKAMLMDITNAMFIIVPPNMISSIGGPELIPLLLRTKQEQSKSGTIILLLEDADQCLAPRASDNISSISSILQLGDGLFGSLFDVRVIATTNTRAKEIDSAITRNGRLSKRISVGSMEYVEADKIFRRIVKGDLALPKVEVEERGMKPRESSKYTLADVYKAARNAGWKPEPIEVPVGSPEFPPDYYEEEFDFE